MQRTFWYAGVSTGLAVLLAGAMLLGVTLAGGLAAPVDAAPGDPTPPADPASGEILGEIEFRAFDLGFEPAMVEVSAPGRYTVRLVNDGAIVHDIRFGDDAPIVAQAGETAVGEVIVPEGGVDFICSIPGHADGGMAGMIHVAGQTPSPGADPAAPEAVEKDPNAPPYELYDPVAPPLAEGEVHEVELVMTEREMTVADGFVQKVWTFGDTVPGPVFRIKVGDTLRITLKNPAENEMPHSIDFHASLVAWNDEMRSINPGEELVYEFEAKYAGVYMYHCGTSPALHHIANGMYGMIIVEPREGLEPVDHEFALVQGEWYLGPQGEVSSLAKASAGAPAPEFVAFNGVANQYLDHPIEVPVGETVRVFVLNAGPSVDSSFHVVGTIFDQVVKEGVALLRGNEGNWGSQAVDLSPAQGAIAEFHFDEDGLYPIVTHAFNFVGRGALGLFQAGDGGAAMEGGH